MLKLTKTLALLASLLVLHAALAAPQGLSSPQRGDGLKSRVESLQSKGRPVTLKTTDNVVARGTIVRVDQDSFTLAEDKTGRETVIPFSRLTEIKSASSGHKKAILIPAAIAGGAVLVLCVAPYPIGFLCRKDPS